MKREPWFPMDANYQDDPDIIVLSLGAEVAYFRSVALAKRLKGDGVVTDGLLRRICDKFDQLGNQPSDMEAAIAHELVDVGLWQLTEGGYLITAYESWNGDADLAAQLAPELGRWGAHLRHHVEKDKTSPKCRYCMGAPPPQGIAPHSPPPEASP